MKEALLLFRVRNWARALETESERRVLGVYPACTLATRCKKYIPVTDWGNFPFVIKKSCSKLLNMPYYGVLHNLPCSWLDVPKTPCGVGRRCQERNTKMSGTFEWLDTGTEDLRSLELYREEWGKWTKEK